MNTVRPSAATPDRSIRERNRTMILKAAAKAFAKKGFEGASIAEIAGLCGLPKANVYYYFKTKQAIYRTLMQDLIREWDGALAHLSADRHPADAIAAYVRAKLDFSRRHAVQSKIFANEAVHGGRLLSRLDRAHMRDATMEKARVFEAWAAAGKMDPVHPMHLFILLWASTQFYADFDVLAGNVLGGQPITPADYETAAATITGIVLKGCGIAPS